MRKIVAVVVVMLVATVLVGCSNAKVIIGDCSEVVEACQGLSGNANVTVKGKVVMEGSTKDEAYVMSDHGKAGEPWVYVTFKSIDDAAKVKKGDTVKVKGDVSSGGVQERAVFVNNAVIVG